MNMPFKETRKTVEEAITNSTLAGIMSIFLAFGVGAIGSLPLTLMFLYLTHINIENVAKWKRVARTKGWYA